MLNLQISSGKKHLYYEEMLISPWKSWVLFKKLSLISERHKLNPNQEMSQLTWEKNTSENQFPFHKDKI